MHRISCPDPGDNTVRVWQVATGQCIQTLEGHTDWVTSVAFSHDASHIVSGSWDNTVRVWQVATGQCIQTLEGHTDWVRSVAFSHDASHIVSGSWDNTVRVWQVATGQCIQTTDIGVATQSLRLTRDQRGHLQVITDVGAIVVNTPALAGSSPAGPPKGAPPDLPTVLPSRPMAGHRTGYGFSGDRCWVTWHGTDLLWLPAECRPVCSAVAASGVAIGCPTGRVVVLGFSSGQLPPSLRRLQHVGGGVDE